MRYILVSKSKALEYGFNPDTHKSIGNKIIIAENETRHKWQDFNTAVKDLDGELKTPQQLNLPHP